MRGDSHQAFGRFSEKGTCVRESSRFNFKGFLGADQKSEFGREADGVNLGADRGATLNDNYVGTIDFDGCACTWPYLGENMT
eukprot:5239166-Pleurochrysis_carterae.AAC.4